MSTGVKTIKLRKGLVLDKRPGTGNWQARITISGKRETQTTGTDNLEEAKEFAYDLFAEKKVRVKSNLPTSTRKFKRVAEHTIKRMQNDLAAGVGKQAYKDYIQALNNYHIPFFGKYDLDKIDFKNLKKFDAWRTTKAGKQLAQSTINNHNAALERVFNEAELHGWMHKAMRPTLMNKGIKAESRGSFSVQEYKTLYTILRTWHKKTTNVQQAATREILRNYVLILANTGMRQGTEALQLKWKNIEWVYKGDERYLAFNVDGKTGKRQCIARDRAEEFFWRQAKLNPKINAESFEELLKQKFDEKVFTTCLGEAARLPNLIRAFKKLLDEQNLYIGADGKKRTLYSLRHFYATQELERGMSTHALAKQMGTSTKMIDKHYSKYAVVINAAQHSGRQR